MNKNDLYVLVEVVAGSRLYGTYRPDSDYDYRGVCLAPIPSLIGLDPTFQQVEETKPVDRVVMELRKFLGLALGNNPNILDTLFAPPGMWVKSNRDWNSIWMHRHDVLSQKVRDSYAGYARSQLGRIEGHVKWLQNPPEEPDIRAYGMYLQPSNKWAFFDQESEARYRKRKKEWDNYSEWLKGRNPARHELEVKHGYDTKHAGHLFRLLFQAEHILEHGDFSPVLEGSDLETIKMIMNGGISYDTLLVEAERCFRQVDTMPSDLPAEPFRARLSSAVMAVYGDYIARQLVV